MPIPPNVTATIGRYKPSEIGRIFSACALEIIDTSINDSSDNCGIQWEILNSSDEVKMDRAPTEQELTYPSSSSSGRS